MGTAKRTRKFATVKRIISQRDDRLKKNIAKNEEANKKKRKQGDELIREVYVCCRTVTRY
jgi:U3 small nucleolar RNA-associated protein 24